MVAFVKIDAHSQTIPLPSIPPINQGNYTIRGDSNEHYNFSTNYFDGMTLNADTVFKCFVNNIALDTTNTLRAFPIKIPVSLFQSGNNSIKIQAMLSNSQNVLLTEQLFNLTVCQPTLVTIFPTDTNVNIGSTTIFSATSGFFSYSWSAVGSDTILNGNGTDSISIFSQNYGNSRLLLTVTDSLGCSYNAFAVHRTLCSLPSQIVIGDPIIGGTQYFTNTVYRIDNGLQVKTGSKLIIENCELIFNPCTKLIVEAGAQLIIRNSKLRGCNTSWIGIEAHAKEGFTNRDPLVNFNQGSSYIEITNKTIIQDADIAILAGKRDYINNQYFPGSGGAILKIQETTFDNNRCHIAFLGFNNIDNKSEVKDCIFNNLNTDFTGSCFNAFHDYYLIHPTQLSNPSSQIGYQLPLFRTLFPYAWNYIYVCNNKDLTFDGNYLKSNSRFNSTYKTIGYSLINTENIKIKNSNILRLIAFGVVSWRGKLNQIENCKMLFDSRNTSTESSFYFGHECDNIKLFRNSTLGYYSTTVLLKNTHWVEMFENKFNSTDRRKINLFDCVNTIINANKFSGTSIFNTIEYSNGIASEFIGNIIENQMSFDSFMKLNNFVGLNFRSNSFKNSSVFNNFTVNAAFGSILSFVDNNFAENSIIGINLNDLNGAFFNGNTFVGNNRIGVLLDKVDNFELDNSDYLSKSTIGFKITNSINGYVRQNRILGKSINCAINFLGSKRVDVSENVVSNDNLLSLDEDELAYYQISFPRKRGYGIKIEDECNNINLRLNSFNFSNTGIAYFNRDDLARPNSVFNSFIRNDFTNNYGITITYANDPLNFTLPIFSSAKHGLTLKCNTFTSQVADIVGYGNLVDQGNATTDPTNTFTGGNVPDLLWYNTASPSNFFKYYFVQGNAFQIPSSLPIYGQTAVLNPGNAIPYLAKNNGTFDPQSANNFEDCSVLKPEGATFHKADSLPSALTIDNNLKIYPNPAEDVLYVSSNSKIEEIQIFDMFGRLSNLEKLGTSNEISLLPFTAGIYTLRVIFEDGSIASQKFLKR